MTLVEDADRTAAEAHAGQTRRHGAPYIDHPRAVARLVDDLAAVCGVAVDEDARAAALLHDVVEDSAAHGADVVAARFGAAVARDVVHLTKTGKGEAAVAAYYERLRSEGRTSTKLIKVCDRLHNLSELHKARDAKKLREYVDETRRFVRPLAEDVSQGLVAAVDDAIDNARRNQGEHTARPAFGVYAIVDDVARLPALLDGGVARVQLRTKGALDDRALLALVERAVALCRPRGVPLIVNDRADVALAGGADGVHVGQTDLPARAVRRIAGDALLVGVSNHTPAQLRQSDVDGAADHLAFGPVWASPTKQGHADVVGMGALAEVCAATQKPVVAIGGVTDVERAAAAARAGAEFCAVVSAFRVDDPSALHALVRRFCLSFVAARALSGRTR